MRWDLRSSYGRISANTYATWQTPSPLARQVPLLCQVIGLDLGKDFAEYPTDGTRRIHLCLKGVRQVPYAKS
jgi:hypothetical protein